jgi:hypothetical protein
MALSFLKERNELNLKIKLKLKLDLELEKKCESEYTFFSNFFNPILKLDKNDKIGIQIIKDINMNYMNLNFTLYLDKYNIYQSFNRWYYKQDRTEIFKKLDQLFEEYHIFLKSSSSIKNEIINNNIINLNTILITKLELLKCTYDTDNNICEKINNYLQILSHP